MTEPTENDTSHTPRESELAALLGVFSLHGFIDSLTDEIDDGVGIPYFERKIVVWLDRPKRIGALARELNVLPSTMTAAADQLEQQGLAVRVRDPDDRRAWLLKLTDAGEDLRTAMVVMARTLFCETLGLSVDELDSFARTALKIHQNIQKHLTC